MGLMDVRLEVSEEDYAFLRWQAVKLNTSVPAYVKRLIVEDQKRKKENPPVDELRRFHA